MFYRMWITGLLIYLFLFIGMFITYHSVDISLPFFISALYWFIVGIIEGVILIKPLNYKKPYKSVRLKEELNFRKTFQKWKTIKFRDYWAKFITGCITVIALILFNQIVHLIAVVIGYSLVMEMITIRKINEEKETTNQARNR